MLTSNWELGKFIDLLRRSILDTFTPVDHTHILKVLNNILSTHLRPWRDCLALIKL